MIRLYEPLEQRWNVGIGAAVMLIDFVKNKGPSVRTSRSLGCPENVFYHRFSASVYAANPTWTRRNCACQAFLISVTAR